MRFALLGLCLCCCVVACGYERPNIAEVPTVCGSLRQAIDSLKADHDFLTKGDVFTKDTIDAYIDLRMEEVMAFETAPHPIEFKMYYSV